MRCFNSTLDTPILNTCPDIVGVEANSYIVPRKYIKNKVITDAECTFDIIQNLIPVFVPGDLPYKPTSNGTNNAYGLQKFTKTVEFFFLENTALTQKQINELQNDSWVQVFKDNNGQNLVFGLESGLRFNTSSQDFNSLETHGGVVVVMQESNVNTPMLFTTNAIYNWINYEYISGLTIGNGSVTTQKMYLSTGAGTTCYIVQPNGAVLTSTGGIIDIAYAGIAGNITLIVPKNGNINIQESKYIGELNTLATDLTCGYCDALTSINAPLLINIYCVSCDLLTSIFAPLVLNIQCATCASLISISTASVIELRCDSCVSLTSVSVPMANILDIGGCTSLTSVSAPMAISFDCQGCTSLTSVSAPSATNFYCSECPLLTYLSAPLAIELYCNDCTSFPLQGFINWATEVQAENTINGIADFTGCAFDVDDVDNTTESNELKYWLTLNGWDLVFTI